MRSRISFFLSLSIFAALFAITIVHATLNPCYYDEDNLPVIGETTLATDIKSDNLAEFATNHAGACETSFYVRMDRRSNGTTGSWTANSDNYLIIANSTQYLDFYNVTTNTSVRLRGWRYYFNSGRVVGNITFY